MGTRLREMFCSYRAVMIVIIVVSLINKVEGDCSPVKEGDTRVLTCTVSSSGCSIPVFYWGIKTTSGGSVSIRCSPSSCSNRLGDIIPNVTISGSGSSYTSSLTVKADRTVTLDWSSPITCGDCERNEQTICPELPIYSLPENPTCSVTREPNSDDFTKLRLSCSTSKIYPQPRCKLYYIKDGSNAFHYRGMAYPLPPPYGEPMYYSRLCYTIIPVSSLQEGTYTFKGRIYPDVVGGDSLDGVVDTFVPGPGVTLSLPTASHTCAAELKDGYFKGRFTTCTCSLVSEGNPKGTSKWYLGSSVAGIQNHDGSGSAIIAVRVSGSNNVYTCDVVSSLGRNTGTKLTPKFAYLDEASVEISTTSATIDLCGGSINQPTVTCRVPKSKVNPAPHFSFSVKGVDVDTPQQGSVSGSYYQTEYTLTESLAGSHQVTCKVANTVFTDMIQEKSLDIEYRNRPSVTISDLSQASVHNETQAILSCTAKGDPTPSITLTRQRTSEVLQTTGGGGNKNQRLDHKFTATCLDTGVYVCSARNSQGSTTDATTMHVQCPHQFDSAPNTIIEGSIGGHLGLSVQTYGYPAPTSLTMKNIDGVEMKLHSRFHLVYKVTQLPFGSLDVFIQDVTARDFSTYTITLDNGVGDALVHTFVFKEKTLLEHHKEKDSDHSNNSIHTITIVGGVVAVVIIAALVVVVVILLQKRRKSDNIKNETAEDKADSYVNLSNINTQSEPVTDTPAAAEDNNNGHSRDDDRYETILDEDVNNQTYSTASDDTRDPPNLYKRFIRPPTNQTPNSNQTPRAGQYNNVAIEQGYEMVVVPR